MLVLTWIRKLYKTLSADASPTAIALAASIGIVAGFLPINSGAFLVLLLALLIFRPRTGRDQQWDDAQNE